MNKIITILLVWFFTIGATYYVKNGGSDLADGLSDGNAWETIAKAEGEIGSGDTLYLKRGSTWAEDLSIDVSNVTVDAYGSGNKPDINGLTITETTGVTAQNLKITASASVSAIVYESQDIIVKKCEVDGAAFSGHALVTYSTGTWCSNVLFEGNEVYGGESNIAFQQYTRDSYIINNIAHDSTVEDNILPWSGVEAGGNTNILVFGNVCYNAAAHGINLGWYLSDSIVENNFCYNNGNAGITTDTYADNNIIRNNLLVNNVNNIVCVGGSSNTQILNNTSVAGASTVEAMYFTSGSGTGNVYYNNIFYALESWWPNIFIEGDAAGNVVGDYNLFYNVVQLNMMYGGSYGDNIYTTLADWQTASGQDANSVTGDPLFIVANNYNLQVGSPAKDAGTTLTSVLQDYRGILRPQDSGYDIGAFEYAKGIRLSGVQLNNINVN